MADPVGGMLFRRSRMSMFACTFNMLTRWESMPPLAIIYAINFTNPYNNHSHDNSPQPKSDSMRLRGAI